MRLIRRTKGQTMIEYVVLFVAAAVAFISMFGYVRSAFMHRAKGGADGLGHGILYKPGQL